MKTTYGIVAKSLHWAMAILILGQIAGGVIMHKMEASQLKFDLYQYHKSFGFLVLALAIIRLVWRFTNPPPVLPATMKPWEKGVSQFTHWFFYVFMILMPLIGWAIVSTSTKAQPTEFFGLFSIPHLPLPKGTDLHGIMEEVHEYYAFATLGLVVLHIAAALKHHFKDKDGVLKRMLP